METEPTNEPLPAPLQQPGTPEVPSSGAVPTIAIDAATTAPSITANTSSPPPLSFGPVPQEFVEDLNERLGRANGNVYHRKPGLENVHDGQIMVRLKKKRFIVIDYNPVENNTVHKQPRHVCANASCPKVGVPILLYDSEPSQPTSLYMRSGLCFTCQRALNEKRRTQRKRKGDVVSSVAGSQNRLASGHHNAHDLLMSQHQTAAALAAGSLKLNGHSDGYFVDGFGSISVHGMHTRKRVKMNGNNELEEVSKDAIVIDGPIEGTRPFDENGGYGCNEIGVDLQTISREAVQDVDRLVDTVEDVAATAITSANQQSAVETAAAAAAASADHNPVAVAAAAAAAAAVSSGVANSNDEAATADAVAAANAAVSSLIVPDVTSSDVGQAQHIPQNNVSHLSPSKEEITALYEKSMHSLKRSIYLLAQWKVAWDSNVGKNPNCTVQFQGAPVGGPGETAAAEGGNINSDVVDPTGGDSSQNDTGGSGNDLDENASSNMIPLLLAAEAKEDEGENKPGLIQVQANDGVLNATNDVEANKDLQVFGV